MKALITQLATNHQATRQELLELLQAPYEEEFTHFLKQAAQKTREAAYGKEVFIRGLLEFTNYCKNNCYYCGIRAGNSKASRYRLSQEEILSCCNQGYALGFRTFVLQGGEDPYFTDEKICKIVAAIKEAHPDCAVTLSIGEKSRSSYAAYYQAGADRYLLRHETANSSHYGQLHPPTMSLANRKRCLWDLKDLGYQVGSGIMVGSPYQTSQHLLEDLEFLQDLKPDMIGIGPYLNHPDTPFKKQPQGSLKLTLWLLSLLRLLFPYALLPATTALGTLHPQGRSLGLMAGANVVMPNLSPVNVREKYSLYANKLATGAEAAESLDLLKEEITKAGFKASMNIGHVNKLAKNAYLKEINHG